ncbi:MAG: hypothetical protein ABSH41_04930, partial [Syntrophobacteraceae bacterium]
MKKYLLIFAVALVALSVAMPALADVEFLYGGQFRWRINASDGNMSGTEEGGYYGNFQPQTITSVGKPNGYWNANDNRFYIDQRLRLYFTFQGSPNLKVVTKFEMGDTTWGDPGLAASQVGIRTGQNGGGEIGADSTSIEIKNAYLEFKVPVCPTTTILGIQTISLLDSWILDDDFSAAVFITKLDPFRIAVGYIGGQYGAERRYGSSGPPEATSGFSNTFLSYTNQSLNLDTVFMSVDYACAPWKATVVGLYQDGHQTTTSFDPTTLNTPVSSYTGFTNNGFIPNFQNISQNNLFDIGVNVTYKTDWLLGYVNFVQNLGSVSYTNPVPVEAIEFIPITLGGKKINSGFNTLKPTGSISESDYTGYMIDVGLTYFCTPFTFNVGGFLTSGPEFSSNVASNGIGSSTPTFNTGTKFTTAKNFEGKTIKVFPGQENPGSEIAPFRMMTSTDVTWFTYPLATAKYSSEIIGGGVLGDDVYIERGYKQGFSVSTIESGGPGAGGLAGTDYWRGYGFPNNLYTITAGSSYQLCPGTKLSASYWYWGTPDAVPVAFDPSSLTPHGVNPALPISRTNPFAYSSATEYTMSSA